MAKKVWTKERRKMMQELLQNGYSITKVSKALEISKPVIYKELKETLSQKDYEERRFIKYTASAGLNKEICKLKNL